LVQPLIRHSLDYIIEDKLKEKNPEEALISIKVCDVACGSGHFLLNAARRIGAALASIRTGEEQPSPEPLRIAIRDIIRNCIYGVDKNPLAVELCKVALWLEAHNPGEPLNFLDHRIKCGDAIVGLASAEELQNGISNQAFKTLPGDDKIIAAELRKKNTEERKQKEQISVNFETKVGTGVKNIAQSFLDLNNLPENTPEQIKEKQVIYEEILSGSRWWQLKTLADIQVAQFFIPKTEVNKYKIVTDEQYRRYLAGRHPIGQAVGKSMAISTERWFFHWFLEFPEVFVKGGFDCIVGNPPFLGGKRISGNLGEDYLNILKSYYVPSKGGLDIVVYFFRRIFTLIKREGFQSLISTNTIAQGDSRNGGLAVIQENGGDINYAVKNIIWPGAAAVQVSLICIFKGIWKGRRLLDKNEVYYISSYLDDQEITQSPHKIFSNLHKCFIGSLILGKGFILDDITLDRLLKKNKVNKKVLFRYLSGNDLNSRPDLSPSRWVINFFDWSLSKSKKEFPDCFEIVEKYVKPERIILKDKGYKERWWQFGRRAVELYKSITEFEKVLVVPVVSKYSLFCFVPSNYVYMHKIAVFIFEDYSHFAQLANSFHNIWGWKYSSTLGSNTLNYSPTDCFETFPFPRQVDNRMNDELLKTGMILDSYRTQLLISIKLGRTKTYNQFHNPHLSETVSSEAANSEVVKQLNKESTFLQKHLQKTPGTICYNEAVRDIKKLRELHVEMDQAVLTAYGWDRKATEEDHKRQAEEKKKIPDKFYPPLYDTAIDLRHDFYEVDYLPENDRVRFTIHPDARREVLKRLLELNHAMHEWEVRQGLWDKKKSKKKDQRKKNNNNPGQRALGL
jgi:hypothetical protein